MEKKLFLFMLCLLCGAGLFAQKAISGKVVDSKGVPLPAVTVAEKGTTNGVVTDMDGKFNLTVKDNAILQFSSVGFANQEVPVGNNTTFDITLKEDTKTLGEVSVTGTRTPPRTNTTAPLPIDVISSKDISNTAQNTFDKALQYKIPSFNTVQTPVNDATSLLDPYEIRNMGPSRTLILINGKRKNLSSLLYTQASPGVGETGADLSAIPTQAIKRVEILRDGASAQYGSDAIAGVMNIILKNDSTGGDFSVRTGITHKGDGFKYGVNFNNGVNFNDKGYINYTIDLFKENLANRPGKVDAEADSKAFNAKIEDVNKFLSKFPDAKNINGSPENAAVKFMINGGNYLSSKTEFYYNAAYVNKSVNSFANYRTPYWIQDDYGYLTPPDANGNKNYIGFGPTFRGNLTDYNATIGVKSVINGWNTDISYTTGGNKQDYSVTNTINIGLEMERRAAIDFNNKNKAAIDSGKVQAKPVRAASPTSFRPGGVIFKHHVGNIDFSKVLNEHFSIGIGGEYRAEQYEVQAGDEESYILGGANSYAGNHRANAGVFYRNNIGGYFDLAYDVTPDLLLNATVRGENYSDFGPALVYKLSTRYKLLNDKITFRGSYSTGFRAPTLHQIYTQKAQYNFVDNKVQVSGLLNNVSKEAVALGVPSLKPEKSNSITVGLGLRPTNNFSITLDYYNIQIKDRITFSEMIDAKGVDPKSSLSTILKESDIVNLNFFSNALNTVTSGIDFVTTYKNIGIGAGNLGVNIAGNLTLENKATKVINPKAIADVGKSVYGPTMEALLFTSRPKYKAILGFDYEIKKVSFSLNNTLFGPAKFRNNGMDTSLAVVFAPKVITDLGIGYKVTEKISVALNINNIFNVLPAWKLVALNDNGTKILNDPALKKAQENGLTFSGRYRITTHDAAHFSQLGTIYNLTFNYRF